MCSHGCASRGIIFLFIRIRATISFSRSSREKLSNEKLRFRAARHWRRPSEEARNKKPREGEFNNFSASSVTDAGVNTKILTSERLWCLIDTTKPSSAASLSYARQAK